MEKKDHVLLGAALTVGAVEGWLDEHVDPETGYVVDDTLAIEGAAADSKATGDAIAAVEAAIPAVDATLATTGAAADAKKTGDEIADLKSAIEDVDMWLGYAPNLFKGTFTTTHSSNWTISQSGNSVTFTHLTSYTSGFPMAELDIPAGTYNYTANYNGGTGLLSLYKGSGAATYVKQLSESDTITLEADETYYLRIGSIPDEGDSITISDIKVTESVEAGAIPDMEEQIQDIEEQIAPFPQLYESAKVSLPYTSTTDKFINSSGVISTAGSNAFHIATCAVTAGWTYWIDASTKWGNSYFAFYDDNDDLVQNGTQSPSAVTSITNYEVVAPTGATKIVVAYHDDGVAAKIVTAMVTNYKTKWGGKKWVCVGDSLTAVNDKTSKHYFDYVADETGITVVNMGYSGSGYARLSDEDHAFYQRISSCPTDADVVTIFGSFNDLGAELELGTVTDSGTTTLAGCINTTIDNLQTRIPLANLGIVAPTPWDTTQPATSGQAYNYVEMLKAICEHRSIPFLDLWRGSNLRPWDSDFRTVAYSHDGGSGTHPDENGHKLIAPPFEAFLDRLLLH